MPAECVCARTQSAASVSSRGLESMSYDSYYVAILKIWIMIEKSKLVKYCQSLLLGGWI